ncbi:MAG: tRNA preQ1(34) S-adenosylmethionine ribosyltransferase-isomerase QueA [Acidobacteriaceae bacterium]
MLLTDFDFELPPDLIAQSPLAERAGARMLRITRAGCGMRDRQFCELPRLLRSDDLLVFNNTRVIPARLFGRRSGARAQVLSARNPAMREFLSGRVEVLLTRRVGEWEWEALVRPGRKLAVGERVWFYPGDKQAGEPLRAEEDAHQGAALQCEIVARGEFGERRIRFEQVQDFEQRLHAVGHVPLPPYITREDTAADRERYQTVFARAENAGAAAAPTAGLHFTAEVLDEIRARGIESTEVTLHVGLGTFQPLREATVEANHLHCERYEITEAAAEKIARAQREQRRIVAVGTTSVRTLEFAARQAHDGMVGAGAGEADLFIYPGYQFRVVGAMLTNFHLPQSSLLMLVCAFAGKDFVLSAYHHAISERYRFFSYGDCMLVE